MKVLLFLVGIVLLIVIEIARVYYIMPFPGSQVEEMIDVAYFLHQYIWVFRVIGIALIAYPAFIFIVGTNPYIKWTVAALLGFWVIVFYAFNFRFLADKMFYQPETIVLLPAKDNKVSDQQLVIGVVLDGKAKAYPIEVIGYHHQVRDTLAGKDLMVTYCTVCRTGRVFSPEVDGKPETFRLVGMDHYNAMFEDATTHSWWRQVSGEAITGPSKGKKLNEIPSEQMTLRSWLEHYPNSTILQPDPKFKDRYEVLEKYDEGKMEGRLEGRDSLSWKDKSWVVGVPMGLFAKAYDWNELIQANAINDQIAGKPIVVAMEKDSATFHVWMSVVQSDTLQFQVTDSLKLTDTKYGSRWNWKGECEEGKFVGSKLTPVQSYQEFWHSWKTFHPNTEQYQSKK